MNGVVLGLFAVLAWIAYTVIVQYVRRYEDARWFLIAQGIVIGFMGSFAFGFFTYLSWPYSHEAVLFSECLMMIVVWVVLSSGDRPKRRG